MNERTVNGRTIVVLAKAPQPGRSKTRLCPPCTPRQAAALAAAALADTLDVVAATAARRRVLVLDGSPGPWLPPGFDLLSQRGDGLDERLANAFDDVFASSSGPQPVLLIGMDTPQVMPALLERGFAQLESSARSAVLGPAADGGWWIVGLRRPDRRAFLDVPMSTATTGAAQLARLRSLGLAVGMLPRLLDVDRWADALAVGRIAPATRFARLVERLALESAA